MSRWRSVAIGLFVLPTILLLVQGAVYLATPEFMPYHRDALGVSWEELPARYQAFILGALRVMGAGSICVSLALLTMIVIPFRRGEAWATWAIAVTGTLFSLLAAYGAYIVDAGTPASTPWPYAMGFALFYILGGMVAATRSKSQKQS